MPDSPPVRLPTVPATPALAQVASVELMHTGTWNLSTGPATFTPDDLRQAVAALDCPAVRRPVLKLGHDEPDPGEDKQRWDGEPAVGWVSNLAVAESGCTLVGDYVGMPGWLGDIIASAYPDRSIEGWYDFRCQLNHVHPFVLTAVALLGVTPPGIGTLQSLQDVATLYGVAAAADAPPSQTFAVRISATSRRPRPSGAGQVDHVLLRKALGLAASAPQADVRAALAEYWPPVKPRKPDLPPGVALIDTSALQALRAAAAKHRSGYGGIG